jgi:hypothetical protein
VNTATVITNNRAQDAPTSLPANGQPMSLVEIVEHEALGYKAWRTPEGDFLAREMGRVAQLLRWTGARTPEDHEDRMETYDRELRERYYDRGYHDGLEAGRNEWRRGQCLLDRD